MERQGSLTAAARSLGLTQSALSHTVRKLEQQIGTRIWEREGRSLQLTSAGRSLLALAQRLLPQLEHAEHVLGQIARGERGTLRVGMECHPTQQIGVGFGGRFFQRGFGSRMSRTDSDLNCAATGGRPGRRLV